MDSASHQSCFDCLLRPDRLFCDLPTHALEAFDSIKCLVHYPRGSLLFEEGQTARGIFVLCEGRVKLSVCSETGKRLTRSPSAGIRVPDTNNGSRSAGGPGWR